MQPVPLFQNALLKKAVFNSKHHADSDNKNTQKRQTERKGDKMSVNTAEAYTMALHLLDFDAEHHHMDVLQSPDIKKGGTGHPTPSVCPETANNNP